MDTVKSLIGKTLAYARMNDEKDEIEFIDTEGRRYLLMHDQD